MALYSLKCADVPLRNCSLTHPPSGFVSHHEHSAPAINAICDCEFY